MRWALAAAWLLVGCTGEAEELGLEEPIRVADATLELGPVPGTPPGEDGLPIEAPGPRVTAIEVANGVLIQGQRRRLITGRVSEDAWSIGVALAGEGNGTWIRTVGTPDPLVAGERVFELFLDVSPDAPAGPGALRFVAIGEDGAGGPQRDAAFCVARDLPDELNGCDPTRVPPAAIVELRWHPHADVDLFLRGPDDAVIDARHPLDPASGGRLLFDSNAACVIDGQNRELIVFEEAPRGTTWLASANLFEACGRPGAEIELSLFRRVETGPDTYDLVREPRVSAWLPAASANGGAGTPLFLDAITF